MQTSASATKSAGRPKKSAGILVYRNSAGETEVLLGHPGGPFWKNKDAGSWTIPKGEPNEGEDLEMAAIREFREETDWDIADAKRQPLIPVKQKAGKWIHAWSVEASRPAEELRSNEFVTEWPPHSGKQQSFPEIDRFAWLSLPLAREKINPAQRGMIDELEKKLGL